MESSFLKNKTEHNVPVVYKNMNMVFEREHNGYEMEIELSSKRKSQFLVDTAAQIEFSFTKYMFLFSYAYTPCIGMLRTDII